jgi:hypothetical protein
MFELFPGQRRVGSSRPSLRAVQLGRPRRRRARTSRPPRVGPHPAPRSSSQSVELLHVLQGAAASLWRAEVVSVDQLLWVNSSTARWAVGRGLEGAAKTGSEPGRGGDRHDPTNWSESNPTGARAERAIGKFSGARSAAHPHRRWSDQSPHLACFHDLAEEAPLPGADRSSGLHFSRVLLLLFAARLRETTFHSRVSVGDDESSCCFADVRFFSISGGVASEAVISPDRRGPRAGQVQVAGSVTRAARNFPGPPLGALDRCALGRVEGASRSTASALPSFIPAVVLKHARQEACRLLGGGTG